MQFGVRRKLVSLICLNLFCDDIILSVFSFISTNNHQRIKSLPWTERSSWKCKQKAFVAFGVASNIDFQQSLESLTIKELRQILKDSTLNRRGIISKLKRKQDLVDFLASNLALSDREAVLHENKDSSLKKIAIDSPAHPISMPKRLGVRKPNVLSPKDALFKKVYDMYPPLKDQECTSLGEEDVRQQWHPLLKEFGTRKRGDMDIIFVGTASCSPGITRGVSCTALRLNSNRQRPLAGVPTGQYEENADASSGGTWLFDCGECTQVRRWTNNSVRKRQQEH